MRDTSTLQPPFALATRHKPAHTIYDVYDWICHINEQWSGTHFLQVLSIDRMESPFGDERIINMPALRQLSAFDLCEFFQCKVRCGAVGSVLAVVSSFQNCFAGSKGGLQVSIKCENKT